MEKDKAPLAEFDRQPASSVACACEVACPVPVPQGALLNRALRLEYISVGWNLVEGAVAMAAALSAGSVAILGFGVDSFVESTSALIMIWRLRAQRDHSVVGARLDVIERRARKLIAGSLFLLAAYISCDAAYTLWHQDRPSFSVLGIALLGLSIGVMLWLARAKRRAARELGSEAMEADAFQTTACWWLSIAALTGVGLNGVFGWWWADPLAGLVIAGLLAREGRDAWAGKDCC